MKKTYSILLALALTLGLCAPRVRAAAAPSEDDWNPAQCALVTVADAGLSQAVLGFVTTATDTQVYILTSSIVVGEENPYVFPDTLLAADGSVNTAASIRAKPVWQDDDALLVLLSVSASEEFIKSHTFFPGLARLSAVSSGETLYRVGLDIGSGNSRCSTTMGLNAVQHSGLAILSSNYPDGQFSLTTAPVEAVGEVMQIGGPVVNAGGLAVGISAYTIVDGELNPEFIISLDELLDAFDAEGITYATGAKGGAFSKSGVSYTGSSSSSGSRSSSGSGSSSGSKGSSGSSGSSSGSGSGGLVDDALSGGAIGLVAAAAAGAFLWLKKKKAPSDKNEQKASRNSGHSAGLTGALVLVGVGGQMDGCRFPLQGTSLAFGRDPSRCAIVYDSTAPGVSSLHCQLILQGGTWCLTDLSSSYGTYLNGRKLEPFAPNPLRPGDTFWLGQPQNSFTLKEG